MRFQPAVLFVAAFVLIAGRPASAETLSGNVVRVINGATLSRLAGKTEYRIRLYGINSPGRRHRQWQPVAAATGRRGAADHIDECLGTG